MAQIKKLVLVVDDEPDVVRIVKTMVEAEGYEVLCAYDGWRFFPNCMNVYRTSSSSIE